MRKEQADVSGHAGGPGVPAQDVFVRAGPLEAVPETRVGAELLRA